jgi:hypothetical protein
VVLKTFVSPYESKAPKIELPYWWNNQIGSLAATILKIRPDILHAIPFAQMHPIPETKQVRNKIKSSANSIYQQQSRIP